MRDQKIQVGVIGLGAIGKRLIQAFAAHEETEISAICDTNEHVLSDVKSQFPLAKTYTNYKAILDDPAVDLVYIAVPPKFHHQIALDALQKKKHILCEKPLANSGQEAEEMKEAAIRAGVVHAINFPTYYRQEFKKMQDLIENGFLGSIRRVEVKVHFAEWPRPWQQNPWIAGREQGGFVREVLPHYLQMIGRLFGQTAAVQSHMDYPEDTELCETGLFARLELENGIVVHLDGLSQIAQKEEVLFKLYGSEGTLALKDWTILQSGKKGEIPSAVNLPNENHTLALVDELVQAIDGKKADLIDFSEGALVQQVLELLLAGENRPVSPQRLKI